MDAISVTYVSLNTLAWINEILLNHREIPAPYEWKYSSLWMMDDESSIIACFCLRGGEGAAECDLPARTGETWL